MARTVGIGIQSFEKLISQNCFYVDKTHFIRQWWENKDDVTLITRPRRFGKTLNMNMLERFLSVQYEGRGEIFEGLSIWKEEKYRRLQGSWPVIFLSFAGIKATTFQDAQKCLSYLIERLYNQFDFLLKGDCLSERERDFFGSVSADMDYYIAVSSIGTLSEYLYRYYGKKVIILLDEYDTPLQEAWVNGYWREMAEFIRGLFNSTFKTNPYLERAVMTGITRVSKESIFSDLNHLTVVTSTSELYADCFGFTEEEVFKALEENGMEEKSEDVKRWYDGFTFGSCRDIYNPWSILNYLKTGKLSPYWANTSSNGLIDKLVREGGTETKISMEKLLKGEHLFKEIDEQIIFDQLDEDENAIWSLLLAGGYLRVESYDMSEETGDERYELSLTNREVHIMFRRMIRKWFSGSRTVYNGFIKAMLEDDVKSMNAYMNRVALATFSFFDSGKSKKEDKAMLCVRNGMIHDAVHKEAFRGDILVEDGKITAIGENLEAGEGAQIVDAQGLDVYPGFVEAHGHIGLDGYGIGYEGMDYNEMNDIVTPHLRGIDGVKPLDAAFPRAAAAGVTCVCVGPGSANVLGGTFTTVKTVGKRADDMVVRDGVAMKCAFGENPKRVYRDKKDSSRMTTAAVLREMLFKTREYMEKKEAAGEDVSKRPAFDMKLEALIPVLRGEIPLKAHAHATEDIFAALRIAREFGVRITLEHVTEGHLIVEELAKENVPLAVGPSLTSASKFELRNKSWTTPGLLAAAGCQVSIITDSPVIPQEYLPLCAGLAVQAGMDPFAALQAITINPAKHAGIADRVGSIEVGKDADLVITDGCPFEVQTKIKHVFIDGRAVEADSGHRFA